MYKITITKMKDNPMYDAEKAKAYRDKSHYSYGLDWNQKTMTKTIEVPALVVDLTEEEFKAIKKAVLETM